MNIHSDKEEDKIILEGHRDTIRSLTMMSRRVKIIAKSEKFGRSDIYQNTDFLISTGDDR